VAVGEEDGVAGEVVVQLEADSQEQRKRQVKKTMQEEEVKET
jgi:hypothetical protein